MPASMLRRHARPISPSWRVAHTPTDQTCTTIDNTHPFPTAKALSSSRRRHAREWAVTLAVLTRPSAGAPPPRRSRWLQPRAQKRHRRSAIGTGELPVLSLGPSNHGKQASKALVDARKSLAPAPPPPPRRRAWAPLKVVGGFRPAPTRARDKSHVVFESWCLWVLTVSSSSPPGVRGGDRNAPRRPGVSPSLSSL